MCNGEIKCELVTFAEAVRAESAFDLAMDIDVNRFFRLKLRNDEIEQAKICKAIYNL